MLLMASFLFIQLILATNSGKDKSVNLAKNLVKNVCLFIELTDSQQVVLRTKAAAYEIKYKSFKNISDVVKKNTLIDGAYLEFRGALDSLLSPIQKDSLESRRQRNLIQNEKR